MIARTAPRSRIVIIEEVQETRDAIKELLKRDGYWVDAVRDEDEACSTGFSETTPSLILHISAGGTEAADSNSAENTRKRRPDPANSNRYLLPGKLFPKVQKKSLVKIFALRRQIRQLQPNSGPYLCEFCAWLRAHTNVFLAFAVSKQLHSLLTAL